MGWASGGNLMDEVIAAVKHSGMDKKHKIEFYKHMINAFQQEDCDTLQECMGTDRAYDIAYLTINPELLDEEC